MMGKKRFLKNKLKKLLTMFPVVAVIGPRQCGKSTLVQSMGKGWKYYDLERPDDYQLISDDPLAFFLRNNNKIIIDEAQQYPALFNVLRGIIDNDRESCGRFILTGSSSPEIVKGLSESLSGRIATIELWPFKMAEFYGKPLPKLYNLLSGKNCSLDQLTSLTTSITPKQVYSHWLLGGYPEPRIKTIKNADFYHIWMNEYFSSYIRRDIQRLFPRLNTHTFRRFITTLSFHAGNVLNKSTIARALEISSVTVSEYLDILHGTFIWRNLRSYEGNSLKMIQKMPKGFFRDQGILHHLLKIDDIDRLLLHPASGNSFEAFVIEEIIRGFQCTMKTAIDFNFYRTRDNAEIDLIIHGPFGLIPIEVKSGTKINKRMLLSLKSFLSDTDAQFGILINNSDKIELLAENIILIPAKYI
jgi:predicted AAA+ superfamily ATPase